MIQLILLSSPVTLLYIFSLFLGHLHLWIHVSLLRLLFVFLSRQPYMTLLPEQRLEVVSWDYFFTLLQRLVCYCWRRVIQRCQLMLLETSRRQLLF